jgi:nicotinic acid phosphoribosyltransferase
LIRARRRDSSRFGRAGRSRFARRANFGRKIRHETNSKGYKVLKNVRIIQGDGVNQDSIKAILQRLKTKAFPPRTSRSASAARFCKN